MNEFPVRYAVLRDKRKWDESVVLSNLVALADGTLSLCGLPGFTTGETVRPTAAFNAQLSGLASGQQGTTFAAITAARKVGVTICGCDLSDEIAGPSHSTQDKNFDSPTGLLIEGDRLFVADSGNGRILVLGLQSFRLLGEWSTGLREPVCLSVDSAKRVYVLDAANKAVLRFDKNGIPDAVFNTAMTAHANVTSPIAMTVGQNDVLYVTDSATSSIFRFDLQGSALPILDPPGATTFMPRAILADDERLYVADAASGFIFVLDTKSSSWLGRIEAYQGPVSALAIDALGALLVKPSLDETIYRLEAGATYVRSGSFVAGPFDAGIEDVWERVWLETRSSAQTEVKLEIAVSSAATIPGAALWQQAPALDVLLRTMKEIHAPRHLWLRVTLSSNDGRSSPQLLQVQAATAAASYLEHLPAIYRRDDRDRFLENWLAMFRSELSDREQLLEEFPRQLDSRTVAEAGLENLGAWLALDLPARLDADERRELLADAQALYRRRSTPAGLREMARRYVGAKIHLFEAFRERRVWQLNGSARLGIDTALPAATPDGIVVPGFTFASRALSGLRGDYYSGTRFEILRHTRIDPAVNFDWKTGGPLDGILPPAELGAEEFSIRWSGQVRPRYSETYTFRTRSDDGVRLWVNGQLIIDDWNLHAPSDNVGQIRLEADRWYSIVLEYFENTGYAQMELRWSSSSQKLEIVPQERLYPIADASAELEPERHGGCELLEVGHAIVGQSRPQSAEEFGAPLADDFAHLFSVFVAAAEIPLASQRVALRNLIDAEKPAHTDYRLCLVEPRMRVGIQARLGIDSIVAGSGPTLRLGDAELGTGSYLGAIELAEPVRSERTASLRCD